MSFRAFVTYSRSAVLLHAAKDRITNLFRLSGWPVDTDCGAEAGAGTVAGVTIERTELKPGGPSDDAGIAVNLDLLGFFDCRARAIEAGDGTGAGGGGQTGVVETVYEVPHGAEIGRDIPAVGTGWATTLAYVLELKGSQSEHKPYDGRGQFFTCPQPVVDHTIDCRNKHIGGLIVEPSTGLEQDPLAYFAGPRLH
jgi:hypothetical protein